MRIKHSAVPNPIYELVTTLLVDIDFDEMVTIRAEIFINTEQPNTYRARFYEKEPFRLTPSFPRDSDNRPQDQTDDILNVERNIPFVGIAYDNFIAESIEEAKQILLDGIRNYVVHSTAKEQ